MSIDVPEVSACLLKGQNAYNTPPVGRIKKTTIHIEVNKLYSYDL